MVETVRAASRQRLAQARSEVRLEAGPQPGGVRFYVDGPFRRHGNCHGCRDCDDCFCGDRWDDDVYEVAYDFALRVPAHTDLTLRSGNGGDITVEGVEGVFLVRNVNGSVALERVAGSGKAHTVNGPVIVSLTRAPAESLKLVTVNGDVELRLPAASGVDLQRADDERRSLVRFPLFHLAACPGRALRARRPAGLPQRRLASSPRYGRSIGRHGDPEWRHPGSQANPLGENPCVPTLQSPFS